MLALQNKYAVNFPFLDDVSFIRLLYELEAPNLSLVQKIITFFQLDNDHNLALPKILFFLSYYLSGSLQFKWAVVLSGINVVVLALLLFKEFKKINISYFYFLPVLLLLGQPQFHEVTFWAITGLQHTLVFIWGLLAIQAINQQKLTRSLLFATLATLHLGNGILAFGGIIAILILQKKYAKIFWPILFALLNVGFYFYLKTDISTLQRGSISWFAVPQSFFSLLGSVTTDWLTNGLFWAFLIGVIMFVIWLYLTYQSLWKNINPSPNPVLIAFLAYLFASIALISVFRSENGPLMASRFKLMSPLAISATYILALAFFKNKAALLFYPSLALSALFCVNSFFYYSVEVGNKRNLLWADEFNWSHTQKLMSVSPGFLHNALEFLPALYQKGAWQAPDILIPEDTWQNTHTRGIQIDLRLVPWKQDDYKIYPGSKPEMNQQVFELANFPWDPNKSGPWFILFKNKQSSAYLACPLEFTRNGKMSFLKGNGYLSRKAYLRIQTMILGDGDFSLQLFQKNGEIYSLPYRLNINQSKQTCVFGLNGER